MVSREVGFFSEVLEEHYIGAKEEVEGGWRREEDIQTGFCGPSNTGIRDFFNIK